MLKNAGLCGGSGGFPPPAAVARRLFAIRLLDWGGDEIAGAEGDSRARRARVRRGSRGPGARAAETGRDRRRRCASARGYRVAEASSDADDASEAPADDAAEIDAAETDAAPSGAPHAVSESEPALALELRGVVKTYRGEPAVAGIDLSVPAGSFYGLVGPNGAGKTTTLSMISGLLRADRGEIRVFGEDARANPRAAKRLMGVLPDRMRTFDRLSGRQLLHYVGSLRGLSARSCARARATSSPRPSTWRPRSAVPYPTTPPA